ncbi:hypothetical protein MNV49_004726 [Pseudohyphozyma bogoriensis]|nr:hypothetical protein MNV49_004726 [Pseudohyphozyma bogoriensis]
MLGRNSPFKPTQPLNANGDAQRGATTDPKGLPIESLTIEEIGQANRSAQIDGLMAGASAGFLGSFLTTRLFKQSRNVGLLSGLLYLFTQASLSSNLARASHSGVLLRARLADAAATQGGQSPAEVEERLSKAYWSNEREGGVGGMEEMKDKYQTTRGDH